MNVHPTLLAHPKFLLYKKTLGQGDALEYLLRVWGHCQDRKRGENWGPVNAAYLEGMVNWTGEPGKLYTALAKPYYDKPGWIHADEDGNLIVTNWQEYNSGLIANWYRNPKGRTPRTTPGEAPASHWHTPRTTPGEAPAKPTGLDRTGLDLEEREGTRRSGEVNCPPTLAEVIAHGATLKAPEKFCQDFFKYWEGRGWWMTDTVRMSDYRPILETRWEELHRPDGKKPQGKNAVGASIDRRQRRASIEQLIQTHPANPESSSYSEQCTTEDRKDLTKLRAELERVTRERAAIQTHGLGPTAAAFAGRGGGGAGVHSDGIKNVHAGSAGGLENAPGILRSSQPSGLRALNGHV
jgi:hypothetical protein